MSLDLDMHQKNPVDGQANKTEASQRTVLSQIPTPYIIQTWKKT